MKHFMKDMDILDSPNSLDLTKEIIKDVKYKLGLFTYKGNFESHIRSVLTLPPTNVYARISSRVINYRCGGRVLKIIVKTREIGFFPHEPKISV